MTLLGSDHLDHQFPKKRLTIPPDGKLPVDGGATTNCQCASRALATRVLKGLTCKGRGSVLWAEIYTSNLDERSDGGTFLDYSYGSIWLRWAKRW